MEKVLIFGHQSPDTDSICSSLVKEELDKKNGWDCTKAVRLGKINKETQYVLDYLKIDAPELIEEIQKGQEVVLVDHNEFSQSVKGIENAKILSVTDHHRVANFETIEPLYYTAKPYGCTATILFEEYKQNSHQISKKEAILMLSAIISDTLFLKSPTTTKHDENALNELEKIAGIDVQEYGMNMLKAGTDLSDFSEKELIDLDAKNFEKNGLKFRIAQVNTVSIDDVMQRKQGLEKAILNEIKEKELDLFVLAITDILESNSQIIALGNKTDILEKVCDFKDNTALLKGVVSRKKQLLPMIDENI